MNAASSAPVSLLGGIKCSNGDDGITGYTQIQWTIIRFLFGLKYYYIAIYLNKIKHSLASASTCGRKV